MPVAMKVVGSGLTSYAAVDIGAVPLNMYGLVRRQPFEVRLLSLHGSEGGSLAAKVGVENAAEECLVAVPAKNILRMQVALGSVPPVEQPRTAVCLKTVLALAHMSVRAEGVLIGKTKLANELLALLYARLEKVEEVTTAEMLLRRTEILYDS
jgi:hypothetical protein